MTASREEGSPTPDYDLWSIYSIALATEKSRILVSGYGVRILDWIGARNDEIAITYYSCWECEGTRMFTTLHFEPGVGWNARWRGEKPDANYPKPGAVVFRTDAGPPYDNVDTAEQVFALVPTPNHGFAAGYWLHLRNSRTGKVDDEVERYSIDPGTGADRVETLMGAQAQTWKRQICTPSSILADFNSGKNSKACRGVLQAPKR